MDPNNREPEEYGHAGGGHPPRPRPPRDSLTPDLAPQTPALARTVRLVTGDHLLTVNPVDGSEIESCPPGERPDPPRRLTAAERAEAARATRPPAPPGPARPEAAPPARQDERERLVRLLARGRSVRLTGPAGSGRTSLLDLVAEDCADLAPDGVVRLNGYHRTTDDLLYDLFHAVHHAPLHRPDRAELLTHVREIGAVVVLDDIEFGGAALDELLDATPECAFLLAATPDIPAPSAGAGLEEVFLSGLERAAGRELLERVVGRALTEEESNWAGDLWFESEGLPLRFVQAGALLRRRDRQRAGADAVDEFGVFAAAGRGDTPIDAGPATPPDPADDPQVPLPSLGEAAAPAPLLAAPLSGSARATLRFAVALGGEVPHQAHLPALAGDTHADAALGELASAGLVTTVGSRYRLAAGVQTQLEVAGYGATAADDALNAAQHYAWWAGHPSVTPERVCAEADALLAALAVVVPDTVPPAEGAEAPAVRLARTAAPAFAAGGHWGAWERALRSGAEASRLAGEVADQAYFHHELGVLALCGGQLDRARAELEASIGLRGALADKRGTVAGRRALALVEDRSGGVPGAGVRHQEPQSPPAGIPVTFPPRPPVHSGTLVTYQASPPSSPLTGPSATGPTGSSPASHRTSGGLRGFARRNLVATGAGVLLVAVLGTVVTLGATSENDADTPSQQVGVNPSASQGADDGKLGADVPQDDDSGATDPASTRPTDPGPDGTFGTSDDPTPTDRAEPSDDPSGTRGPGNSPAPSSTTPSGKPSSKPSNSSTSKPPSQTPSQTPSATPSETQSQTPTDPATDTPTATDSAGDTTTSSAPVETGDATDTPAGTPSETDSVI